MSVGDVLFTISEAGLNLEVSKKTEDTIEIYPAANLTPELAAAIEEHKYEIIRILREDEELSRTGIIQSERQVFEVAREFFGLNGKAEAATSARRTARWILKPSGRPKTPQKETSPEKAKEDR